MQVQCYAGRKGDERPVRFQVEDRNYMVEDLIDQWYGPDDAYFKVRADDGHAYLLRRGTFAGNWNLDSLGARR